MPTTVGCIWKNPVLAAPEHKLYAGADYVKGHWTVSTSIQYIKGLYTSVIINNKGVEQQDSFVLWNLREVTESVVLPTSS